MKNKIFIVICLGFFARILAGYFIYGFIGFDEYFNIINPAGEWLFAKIPLWEWREPTRSPFLAIIVYLLFKSFSFFGIREPVTLLRFAQIFFGSASFALVIYVFRKLQGTVIFMAALFFAVPFLDTRIMYETVCAPLILCSLYQLHTGLRENKGTLIYMSALSIGLASMIRFQAGIVYIGMLVSFVFYRPFHTKLILKFLLASIVPLLLQFIIDYVFFGGIFTSLLKYIRFQSQVISIYDHQMWYNFMLFFLALTIPPATIVFGPSMYKSAIKYPCFAVSFLFFLIFHSISPHKEERFMFPVIYIFIFMIAASYYEIRDWFYNRNYSKFFNILVFYAFAINLMLLLPSMFSNTLANVLLPLETLKDRNDFRGVISDSPIIPQFYLAYRGNVKIEHDILKIKRADFKDFNYILSLDPANTEKLLAKYPELQKIGEFPSGIVDRIVYYLNPSKNSRRGYGILFRVNS